MTTSIQQRTEHFSFYGMDRHRLPGIHPHERTDERVPFEEIVEVTYTDEGDQWDAQPCEGLNVYDQAEAYAQRLLAQWPDQSAIEIRDAQGDQYAIVYWERITRF